MWQWQAKDQQISTGGATSIHIPVCGLRRLLQGGHYLSFKSTSAG